MEETKIKTMIWYYVKKYLIIYYIPVMLLEIIIGGLIYFTNLDNEAARNRLYTGWTGLFMFIEVLLFLGVMIYINYKGGKKFGLKGIYGLLLVFLLNLLLSLYNYSKMMNLFGGFVVITFIICLLALPLIFWGNHKQKQELNNLASDHGYPIQK